jgi:site-specific recombinase XerD
MTRSAHAPDFASLVQEFFCERLIQQQNASPHTVASYRDTFRLLLRYLQQRRRKGPAEVALADLSAPTVLAFLDDLERHRGNTIRTRNARLAALRSFMKYAAGRDPTALPVAQRVLAIPQKRFDRPLLGYLTREEVTAIVEAPGQGTWSGRRDRALLSVLYNTGMRVSEAIGLRRADALLDQTRAVRIRGKGRKQRQVPLWKTTAALLTRWLKEVAAAPETPVFPNRRGQPMSRSGIEDRLHEAVRVAAEGCPSLREKSVSPHMLRHTTAMHLLQAGVEVTVIALWLGHESPETTHQYVEADLAMKQRALDNLDELPVKQGRYRPDEELLAFLDGL